MTLEHRLHMSLQQRPGKIFFRRELKSLGGKSQLSVVLKALQAKGVIVRLGQGIYAKQQPAADPSAPVPFNNLKSLVLELFEKLGVDASIMPICPERDISSACIRVLVPAGYRARRRLSLGNWVIAYAPTDEAGPSPCSGLPPVAWPLTTAARVQALARQHQVSYKKTYADIWADQVTRLAGDTVVADPVKDLLQALRQAGKISRREVMELLASHLHEKYRV